MILLLCNVLLLTNANIYHECQILVKQTIDDVRLKFIESPNASPDTILSIEIDLKNCINVCLQSNFFIASDAFFAAISWNSIGLGALDN